MFDMKRKLLRFLFVSAVGFVTQNEDFNAHISVNLVVWNIEEDKKKKKYDRKRLKIYFSAMDYR